MALVEVKNASDAALEWLVAKCEGEPYSRTVTTNGIGVEFPATAYSTDWSQGGPIIEREMRQNGFDLWCGVQTTDGRFAATYTRGVLDCYVYGPTPLIAAMRCYVASKLGDEVEVPDELLGN